MPDHAAGSKKSFKCQGCRTSHINEQFSKCLGTDRKYCNYAFLFGDDYLCTHPNHLDFC